MNKEYYAKKVQEAIRKAGGAAALLDLPEQIKELLKSTTDPKVKSEILDMITEKLQKVD